MKKMGSENSSRRKLTRRKFLATTGAAVAGPLIVPSSVLGLGGATAPNDRVTMGCIGLGGQGSSNMRAFIHDSRVQVVAVCDVDRNHLARARETAKVDENNSYGDFREVISRDDIDCVSIGTPDHWHAIPTVAAARAGKDIYCEKPLSLTLADGRHVSDVVKEEERILQTGTWRRSRPACRRACELVRNGYIGELQTVEVAVPEGYAIRNGDFAGPQPDMPVPPELDYEMWLGPAPYAPYTKGRCHFNFRWILDYSAGYITDWGAHYYDVAQWGMGTDLAGPVSIDAKATFPKGDLYDASTHHRIEFTYANGVKLISKTTTNGPEYGIRFNGSEGSIWVENQELVAEPKWLDSVSLDDAKVRLYASDNHHENFIDCVLERKEPAAPVEVAHRSASLCHVGQIAAMLKRPLAWDPKAETFTNDDEANAMRSREMRIPWELV